MHQSTRSGHVIYWHRKWALSLEEPVWIPDPHFMGYRALGYHLASLCLSGLIYNVGITMRPTSRVLMGVLHEAGLELRPA